MAASRKKPQEVCNGDGMALAASAAAASILSNIAQALDRSALKKERKTLLQERKRLTSILEQWQLAYDRLRMGFERQLEELTRARTHTASLEADVERLTKGNLKLEQELADLRAKVKNAQ